jgi:hypothetical protein
MKKSNIFAYIELSKLVDELKNSASSDKLKEKLKAQSAYFSIIEPRYFSDSLVHEWEGILSFTKQKGARVDEDGNVISNAVSHSIDGLSLTECQNLADQVQELFEKVKNEFQ